MRKLPENLAQAKAGEYSVAAQLLLRGHNPFFPAVDIKVWPLVRQENRHANWNW